MSKTSMDRKLGKINFPRMLKINKFYDIRYTVVDNVCL